MAAMTDDTIPLFSFPALQGKKVTAAFDGGRMSSDGGVMLLSLAERRLGVAERLARCIPDRRDRSRIAHTIADMIRARVFAICCGYEDADDLDDLRSDPGVQARLRAAARHWPGPMFAADLVAVGERAGAERRDAPDLRARRSMDCVLRDCAALGQA